MRQAARGKVTTDERHVEANKALVRRFFEEVMNKGNVDIVDEIFAPEYVNRHAHPGQTPGPNGVRQLVTNVRRAFPDLVEAPDDLVAEGDRVGLRLTLRGTHLGPFRSVEATGKRVEVMGMAIVRDELRDRRDRGTRRPAIASPRAGSSSTARRCGSSSAWSRRRARSAGGHGRN